MMSPSSQRFMPPRMPHHFTMHTRSPWSQAARTLVLPALPLAGLLVAVSLTAAAKPPAATTKAKAIAKPQSSFQRDVSPLVNKYCVGCHSGPQASAGISFDGVTMKDTLLTKRDLWEMVATNVGSRHMPPPGSPMPTDAERRKLVTHIESTYLLADSRVNDPGRVTMRRLNRVEYDNTIRDLTGLDLHLADGFPSDDVGYGFDNIGDVLSLSPLLMEKYLTAAGVAAKTLVRAPEDTIQTRRWEGAQLAQAGGADQPEGKGRLLFTNGEVTVKPTFPMPGRYKVRVQAWQQRAGAEPAKLLLKVSGQDVQTFDIEPTNSRRAKMVEATVFVQVGEQPVSAAFTNDYFNGDSPDPKVKGDRNLIIEGFEVEGPLDVPREVVAKLTPVTPGQARLFAPGKGAKTETERARRILAAFARRAFRRPVTTAEADRIASIYAMGRKNGESFERSIQLGLQATLASPQFLFRVERETGKTRDLNDFELASRLSYFLWASMPDETLLGLAEQGKLHEPAVLAAQTRRMLKDPKAVALTDSFAGQWLQLRKLDRVTPDSQQFTDWNEGLRAAMREETRLYFSTVVREDRSILEFLDSDWTFLNEQLARHYGNTEVKGEKFQRVKLMGGRRGGILTQASILTLTSNPTRTSPVKRGRWVLDNLLNTPPPPPPPDVAQLPDDGAKKEALTGTLRQRLEKHRENPACASCHSRMDPIGFGLENFNAVGAWRTADGGAVVDASGTLPDGKSFNGPAELRTILISKKSLFTRALSEKMLTYAIGRGVERTDRRALDNVATAVAKKDYRFSALVEEIVLSQPFRRRRSEARDGIANKPAVAVAVHDARK